MNYRHAYHAGNFGDVVKHCALIAAIDLLQAKPRGLTFIDTHAGAGSYELTAEEARATREADRGVGRLWSLLPRPGPLARYLGLLRADPRNQGPAPGCYPGSPMLVAALLRPVDRLVCLEMVPGQADRLRRAVAGNAGVHVHVRDFREGLAALVPPDPRPGLALIDPPYEDKGEYADVARTIGRAVRRWPEGRFMVWYPIKGRADVEAMIGGVLEQTTAPVLCLELMLSPADPTRMTGCGVMLVQPPYGFQESLSPSLALAATALGEGGPAHVRWWWPRPEA